MKLLARLGILVLLLASGCAGSPARPAEPLVDGDNETVLTDGMKITAFTPVGKIVIEGKAGYARVYSGDNWSKLVVLRPRNTRWYGSFGLYDPAESNMLGDRLLIDEGRQFFSSESDALRFLARMNRHHPITFNSSGLVIAYDIIPIRGQRPTRHLTIWQIYINGAKPTALRGGVDDNIQISGGSIPDTAVPTQVRVGYPRQLSDKEYDAGQ